MKRARIVVDVVSVTANGPVLGSDRDAVVGSIPQPGLRIILVDGVELTVPPIGRGTLRS